MGGIKHQNMGGKHHWFTIKEILMGGKNIVGKYGWKLKKI